MLRKFIGSVLWALSVGVTGAIMYTAMGIQSNILTGLGVLGLVSASTGIFVAMDAVRDRAPIAFLVALSVWIVGEAFIIPSEINYWSAVVSARAEREMDMERQSNGRRMILDRVSDNIMAKKPARAAAIVQTDIDAALARDIGNTSLGAATASCMDLNSRSIWRCKTVLALRSELAIVQEYDKAASMVWDANTKVGATNDAHGAHDGPMQLADMLGGTPKRWGQALMVVTIALLFITRGLGLYIGWRRAPAKRPVPDETTPANVFADVTPKHWPALAPTAAEVSPEPVPALPMPSNVVPIRQPVLTKPKLVPEADPKSIESIVAAAVQSMPPGEHPIPDIAKAVKTLATARGVDDIPHPTAIGVVLSKRLGYLGRRGSLKRDGHRSMVYNLVGSVRQEKACVA
jgi:hypothetical protein